MINQKLFDAFSESGIILTVPELSDLKDNLKKYGYEIKEIQKPGTKGYHDVDEFYKD